MTTQQVHRGSAGGTDWVGRFCADVPPGKILLVCRPSSFRRSGAEELLAGTPLAEAPRFTDFESNPQERDVLRGVELFREMDARALVAIGGGSIMDMAKLIDFFGSLDTNLDAYNAGDIPAGDCRPLLAAPTTSGSGSEATHFAVLYRGEDKFSIADARVRPSHVWLVPEFTASMSPYQTACSGMDALAQSIESGWARGGTDASRLVAAEARQLALAHLLGAVQNPTPTHRAGMLDASYLAGKAIDVSKTTGAHAFSYILTSRFGLPHGHAVGLLLPHFVRHHQENGVTLDGINASLIEKLLNQLELSKTVPVSAGELFDLLMSHVNLERLHNNPVAISDEFVRNVANRLAGG